MKIQFIPAIILLSVFASCSTGNKPVDISPEGKAKDARYETTKVQEQALSSYTRIPGVLKPFNQVNIFPKANGFVKNILVDLGTRVKKGQLLMTLEAPELESQLQSANSRYLQSRENASASAEKYRRLKEAAREEGAVSQLDLDNALSRMRGDKAIAEAERSNVSSVRTMQDYLKVYAPFDGVIVDRNISPGALVSAGKSSDLPMLVLQDLTHMRLEVSIPEDYVDKVDLEQQVSFHFNALPGEKRKARISRSANSLGNMRQETVEIDVANKDNRLKAGMYAEVEIPLKSGSTSLLVPNAAIVRSTEKKYVVTVSGGKTQLVDIKEGMKGNDLTEVFGELKAGDEIISPANDEIKAGEKL
ncbi:efflux RND transporter periplasmic adaptor subunit [Pedobacter soli]|uniref:RND family efflux transporter, MFP subunit n=1 Tax=Pedobacter soli TaxID=390242 RepID=A0A1G6VE53_9SPHI|nr:efflux RND transporter periplasmic adaptor subunit [Pedobacter soli]SDD51970.1 RND family efflux transporter, MFP subunit [Pedobacter soli]